MFGRILLIVVCASAVTILVSIVVVKASNRSAFSNIAIGALLALAAILGAGVIALLLTRAAFPR